MNAYIIKVIVDEQRRALNGIFTCLEELCKERNIVYHSVKLLPINDLFNNAIIPRPYLDTPTGLNEVESDFEESEFEKSSNSENEEGEIPGSTLHTRLRDETLDDEDYDSSS